jgi:hypothetical protein
MKWSFTKSILKVTKTIIDDENIPLKNHYNLIQRLLEEVYNASPENINYNQFFSIILYTG